MFLKLIKFKYSVISVSYTVVIEFQAYDLFRDDCFYCHLVGDIGIYLLN